MSVIEGRDPRTGEIMTVTIDKAMITTIRRTRGHTDLPYLAPGLIDLQVNGYRGHDCNGDQVCADSIAAITQALAGEGVVTWVPTIITASEEAICAGLHAVQQARAMDPMIARAIPYCHVEGPFLSDADGPRGAHDRDQIRPVDADEVARWRLHGPVGVVTVSPHWPHSATAIARIVDMGIAVSIGHTHADPSQITAAVDAGASLSTHLGNGIFSVLPRHPNPIWTQLAEDRLTAGLIGDGHHLPMDTLVSMIRAKGVDRCFLVSDSVALAGSPAGIYDTPVGGRVELTTDGRLLTHGTDLLAGAGVGLAFGLRNVARNTPFALGDVLTLVTRVPARLISARGGSAVGDLRVGAPADIVQLTSDAEIVGVIRQGVMLR